MMLIKGIRTKFIKCDIISFFPSFCLHQNVCPLAIRHQFKVSGAITARFHTRFLSAPVHTALTLKVSDESADFIANFINIYSNAPVQRRHCITNKAKINPNLLQLHCKRQDLFFRELRTIFSEATWWSSYFEISKFASRFDYLRHSQKLIVSRIRAKQLQLPVNCLSSPDYCKHRNSTDDDTDYFYGGTIRNSTLKSWHQDQKAKKNHAHYERTNKSSSKRGPKQISFSVSIFHTTKPSSFLPARQLGRAA
ncbi:hypothetical protein SAMN04488056_12321 [Cohaesibacter marisflavi]|uniref:Uncharacterized protein n=1 Tax=Cohaesibacter marisflavi TaxID=655353 RepID=A0A1I5MT77_9HYPH|nr:hypothetical protein SAMN04488056_12321 [Cohaesibacter marisflavi]